MIKRRSAIEPAIGHMKMDGRLGRNALKGAIGDALHAVLCGAGHNIRMLLSKLRLFLRPVWRELARGIGADWADAASRICRHSLKTDLFSAD